jgi:hypothetical protein
MSVTLGWEPQWVLVKRTDATSNWQVYDVMRGMSLSSYNLLYAENSLAESVNTGTGGEGLIPTSTGISSTGQISSSLAANATYIYIAIRRGPMRTPTTGTSVFSPNAYSTTSSNFAVTTNFPVDLSIGRPRTVVEGGLPFVIDRLRGTRTTSAQSLTTSSTDAESSLPSAGFGYDRNTGYVDNISVPIGYSGQNNIYYNFRRAPSFMDVVCYTGTGSEPRTVNHNLGVAPELMIVKARSSAISWVVYAAPLGSTKHLILNSNGAESNSSTLWYSTTPTSTLFTLGDGGAVNGSGSTYVAYLFASCPGVSKIGTYTGNGSSQTINCGFSGGARFVMIKRTDSTGNWLVGDTARGLVAGNDPLLYLNSTAAEITTLDWLDTDSSGFVVNQDTTANANVNGATYIYLAVA